MSPSHNKRPGRLIGVITTFPTTPTHTANPPTVVPPPPPRLTLPCTAGRWGRGTGPAAAGRRGCTAQGKGGGGGEGERKGRRGGREAPPYSHTVWISHTCWWVLSCPYMGRDGLDRALRGGRGRVQGPGRSDKAAARPRCAMFRTQQHKQSDRLSATRPPTHLQPARCHTPPTHKQVNNLQPQPHTTVLAVCDPSP